MFLHYDVIIFKMIIERFSNDCRKTKTKAIAPTNHNRNKEHNEPITCLSIICNSLEAREKSRVRGVIGFGLHMVYIYIYIYIFNSYSSRTRRI